jgi:hypothetical protein
MSTLFMRSVCVVKAGPKDKQASTKKLTGQALHLDRLRQDVKEPILAHHGDFVLVQGHFRMSLSDYHHGVCAITCEVPDFPGLSAFTVVTGTRLPRDAGKGMAYRKLTPENTVVLEQLLSGERHWTLGFPKG